MKHVQSTYIGWAVWLPYPAGSDAKYSSYAGIGFIDPMMLAVPRPPVVRTALFPTRAEARELAASIRRRGWAGARVEKVRVVIEPATEAPPA